MCTGHLHRRSNEHFQGPHIELWISKQAILYASIISVVLIERDILLNTSMNTMKPHPSAPISQSPPLRHRCWPVRMLRLWPGVGDSTEGGRHKAGSRRSGFEIFLLSQTVRRFFSSPVLGFGMEVYVMINDCIVYSMSICRQSLKDNITDIEWLKEGEISVRINQRGLLTFDLLTMTQKQIPTIMNRLTGKIGSSSSKGLNLGVKTIREYLNWLQTRLHQNHLTYWNTPLVFLLFFDKSIEILGFRRPGAFMPSGSSQRKSAGFVGSFLCQCRGSKEWQSSRGVLEEVDTPGVFFFFGGGEGLGLGFWMCLDFFGVLMVNLDGQWLILCASTTSRFSFVTCWLMPTWPVFVERGGASRQRLPFDGSPGLCGPPLRFLGRSKQMWLGQNPPNR